uniref:Uncharacterized protein n=1 Tax=Plectus sambesii TaxID=2011161 RepID=A0A914V7F3_9BILA
MRSGVILWLLLLLGTSAVQATEVASASVENDDELVESAADTTESSVDLLSVLYKRCWTQCWDGFRDSTGQKNMLYLAQHGFDMDDHEEYCREYNSTRACVRSCVDKRTDLKYLRPFFRRNYLNEIICFKNYNDFRTHLQCYRNEHRQLEFFFVRCGYFAVLYVFKVCKKSHSAGLVESHDEWTVSWGGGGWSTQLSRFWIDAQTTASGRARRRCVFLPPPDPDYTHIARLWPRPRASVHATASERQHVRVVGLDGVAAVNWNCARENPTMPDRRFSCLIALRTKATDCQEGTITAGDTTPERRGQTALGLDSTTVCRPPYNKAPPTVTAKSADQQRDGCVAAAARPLPQLTPLDQSSSSSLVSSPTSLSPSLP